VRSVKVHKGANQNSDTALTKEASGQEGKVLRKGERVLLGSRYFVDKRKE
jgi:hypothetical protein